MKESISYSFLLNIVILFIFTSFAIVMGVLSYYKAFKANTIITETIEKYEGYNCVSAEEIERKLNSIGYNTPFNVTCNGKGDNCMTDVNQNYAVISYNLDIKTSSDKSNMIKYSKYFGDEERYKNMNSTYQCNENGCATNKHYQYGVYTYMYVDAPVISSVIRLPFFSKTDIMYEFRNFYVNKKTDFVFIDTSVGGKTSQTTETVEKIQTTEVESIFDNLYTRKNIDGKIYVNDSYKSEKTSSLDLIGEAVMSYYTNSSTGGNASYEYVFSSITGEGNINIKTRTMIEFIKAQKTDGSLDSTIVTSIQANGKDGGNYRRACGFVLDYSKANGI